MKLIVLLILLIAITCYAQDKWDPVWVRSIYLQNQVDTVWAESWTEKQFIKNLLDLWDEYEKENIDTLRGLRPQEMYLSSDEFLIDKKPYKELMNLRRLEDEGYKYKYRWIINTEITTEPFEFEYIFVKQTSIEGFIEFLKKKRGK